MRHPSFTGIFAASLDENRGCLRVAYLPYFVQYSRRPKEIIGYNFNTKNRATDSPVGRELELQPAAAGVKGPTYLRMEAWNPASYLNGAGPARDAPP